MQNRIIAVDDDPTGCQCVKDVPILTSWDKKLLEETLEEGDIFFILSNSRAMSAAKAYETTKEIATTLKSLQGDKYNLKIISRSDSTLRGHLREELSAFNEVFGPFDGTIIAPFFAEGNRLTINDTHYIQNDNALVPIDETEFAKDPFLGFSTSYLPMYLEEKTSWWEKGDCISISIKDIRTQGTEGIAQKLSLAENNAPVILNAEKNEDFKTAIDAVKLAENAEKKFLFRTAASFVQVYAGIGDNLDVEIEKQVETCLIVAGSYVGLTTRQLNHLTQNLPFLEIVIESGQVLAATPEYLKSTIDKLEKALQQNKKVLVYTERDYKGKGSTQNKIKLAEKLSAFVYNMVAQMNFQPDVIIAKGGITSHDVLKYGLNVNKANVLGQIYPGIPILQLDESSRFSGSLYVIFPGNVGADSALTEIVQKLIK